jgi:diacylglycerol kinase (ATP)
MSNNAPLKKLMVIINPAAGVDRPILGLLNATMKQAGIVWDVRITHKANDARRLAKEAAESGWDIVAAHGGDGTIMEVADGLRGTNVPMAIFPGGTGNAMSGELGIPVDLASAVMLVSNGLYDVRTIDMAATDSQSFILRIGIGFEADMTKINQELKNRFGALAYAYNALNELRTLASAHYKITVDGKTETVEGVSCMVANSGNMSMGGLKLSQKIDVADGLIDVVVFTDANLRTLLNITASILSHADSTEQPQIMHRQGKEITVEADPPQSISIDGEQIKPQTIKAHVLPQSVKVVVPRKEVQ